MTREEAIRVLEEFQVIDDWTMVNLPPMEDAVNMAIKALEDIERWRTWSHTYDNLISKQDAIDAFGLSEKTRKYGGDHSGYDTMMLYEIQDVLESLPSADRPTGMWISEELENMICDEICYYKEVTVDANSLNDLCEGCLIEKMKYGRPIGKWIKSDILPNGWHCSHCDAPVMTDDIEEMLFCPHCGSYNGG